MIDKNSPQLKLTEFLKKTQEKERKDGKINRAQS